MASFLSQMNHPCTAHGYPIPDACDHESIYSCTDRIVCRKDDRTVFAMIFSIVYLYLIPRIYNCMQWKYTLTSISISLVTLIQMSECETIIADTWNDDYIRSDTGDGGWLVTDDAAPPNPDSIDLVTQGTVTWYHGPFTSVSSASTTDQYHLIQYFQCAVRSNVAIRYMYSHCGQNGAKDYLKLLFDNTLQTTTQQTPSDRCLDDDVLESVSSFCAKSSSCSSTVGPWSQMGVGPIPLPTVEPHQRFKIQLIIGINGRKDGTAISNLSIQCTPDLTTTSVPTTALPTTMRPTTANPTTYEPTTMQPTTSNPTTTEPTTSNPTTANPTTPNPTTPNPTTADPTTVHPTTANPTTSNPTTDGPTTSNPTTSNPTTSNPTTSNPTTSDPTTSNPTTTIHPTTSNPTTAIPTTSNPTTADPTTSNPTTDRPTTSDPTTPDPTTAEPTTPNPTTANPTTSNPTTDRPTTSHPTTSNPTTSDPTTTTTNAPTTVSPTATPHTTDDSSDDIVRKSQLKVRSDEGQCNFLCGECLQQIDIIGDDRSWDLTFVAPNHTNCTCPHQQASKQNNLTVSIGDVDVALPEYQLKIEKYVIDNENGDEEEETAIEYGLRLNVLYWEHRPQNCMVSYYVNANEFFGVQARNVLSITFTICGLSEDQLTPQAIANSQQAYVASCAKLFNVSETDVNATIHIGSFCAETQSNRRRLLISTAQDQEVTIVVVFTDAGDAKAAQLNACDAVRQDNPEINGECHVQIGADGDILEDDRTMDDDTDKLPELISSDADPLQIAMIVVATVAFCLFMCVMLYCYTSNQKKLAKKTMELKYGTVSAISPDSKRDIVVNGHERIKSHKMVDPNRPYALHEPNISIKALPRDMQTSERNIKAKHDVVPSSTWSKASPNNIHIDKESPIQIHIRTSTTITHEDMDNINGVKYSSVPVHTPVKEDESDEYMSGITNIFNDVADEDNMSSVTNIFNNITDDMEDQKEYASPQDMIDEVVQRNKANEIEMEDIQIGQKIGSGRFGTVFKATWQGNIVVVKELKYDVGDYTAKLKEMKAEIILASSIPTHRNLVEIFGFIRSPFGVVMHYMAGGSVQHYVYRKYRRNDTQRLPNIIELLFILQKAAAGLKFLHSHALVHRDIACRNILLGKIHNNRIAPSTQVRISDFGLTRQVMDDDTQRTQSNFGPLKWMAPESIKHKTYSKQSDVYMFGITMWEIFYGVEPYMDVNAATVAVDVVVKQQRPQIMDCLMQNEEMSDEYKKLMTQCWAHDAKKRPLFTQITDTLSNLLDQHPTNYWE